MIADKAMVRMTEDQEILQGQDETIEMRGAEEATVEINEEEEVDEAGATQVTEEEEAQADASAVERGVAHVHQDLLEDTIPESLTAKAAEDEVTVQETEVEKDLLKGEEKADETASSGKRKDMILLQP